MIVREGIVVHVYIYTYIFISFALFHDFEGIWPEYEIVSLYSTDYEMCCLWFPALSIVGDVLPDVVPGLCFCDMVVIVGGDSAEDRSLLRQKV